MRFEVDDIVKIAKSSVHYRGNESHNPKDIEGKITTTNRRSDNGYNIGVDWDNGDDNNYKEEDLRLVRRCQAFVDIETRGIVYGTGVMLGDDIPF